MATIEEKSTRAGWLDRFRKSWFPPAAVVTAEKMIARVKVFKPDGRLLALIGPENFDPNCTHIHRAVDSKGRVIAGDPVRREIKVYSAAAQTGAAERSLLEHVGA